MNNVKGNSQKAIFIISRATAVYDKLEPKERKN